MSSPHPDTERPQPLKPKRVLIVVPRWGTDPPESADYRAECMLSLGKWIGAGSSGYEVDTGTVPDLMVQFAREQCAQTAVKLGYDYLGMIDDDMRGPLDLWQRLLKHDVDIVAPLAFMRQPPHYPVIYAVRGGWAPDGTWFEQTTHVVRNYPKDRLFECDAVGFGAVLIKVDVLKRFGPPWFFTFDSTKGRTQTGEDISFCIEARKHGARVFVDSATKLLHLGPRRWIGEETYEAENPAMVNLRDQVGDWNRERSEERLIS